MGTVLVYVAVGVLALAIRTAITRYQLQRSYDSTRFGRVEPTPPDAGHARLDDLVSTLREHGFEVDLHTRLMVGSNDTRVVALLDGSGALAAVQELRGLRPGRYLDLTTLFTDGSVLRTTAYASFVPMPGWYQQVAARRPGTAATVERHRSGCAWLAERGLVPVPVPPGGSAREIERSMRERGERRPLPTPWTILGQPITGGGRYRRPVQDQPAVRAEVERRAAAVRDGN